MPAATLARSWSSSARTAGSNDLSARSVSVLRSRLPESTAHPAAPVYDRGTPAPEGRVQVQDDCLIWRVSHTGKHGDHLNPFRDFPESDHAPLQGDASLPEHLASVIRHSA